MYSTVKAVRGIQGRLHAGSAGVSRRAGNRRALKRSLHASSLSLAPSIAVRYPLPGSSSTNHQRRAKATFSTARPAGPAAEAAAVAEKKAPPCTEDILHDRFLTCVEKEDANGAMAHFAFIACEGGALLTLRRRQLLVLLCEKGMVTEASDLLTNAIASPAFDGQDLSTIASFMYVMCGCLRHGEVDRAVGHFRQASERGIGLFLPLYESLATALFIKGIRGDATEMEAWNVLEYVRQRGMVHGPELCDHALLYAIASDDLSFALRMCQYVDEEGIWCDAGVRDALCHSVGLAIKKLPETATVTREGGDSGDWKVEGTNATVEELWALDSLLQGWLDAEMDDYDDHEEDDDEEDNVAGEEVVEAHVEEIEEKKEGDLVDDVEDVVDYDGGDIQAMSVGDMEGGAPDVVDFDEGLGQDEANDGNDDAVAASRFGEANTAEHAEERAAWKEKEGEKELSADFGGEEFCGDLMDQMSALHPDKEQISFRMDGDEAGSSSFGFPSGQERGGGAGSRWSQRSVYADLVMPYGDPHGEGEQGIVSIPVKISVGQEDNDDDDDDDKNGAV